jgi:hypothetical protein
MLPDRRLPPGALIIEEPPPKPDEPAASHEGRISNMIGRTEP